MGTLTFQIEDTAQKGLQIKVLHKGLLSLRRNGLGIFVTKGYAFFHSPFNPYAVNHLSNT